MIRSEYGECSQTCEGGVKVRSRTHQCLDDTQQEEASCGSSGEYLEWTTWSECSDPCSGERSRFQVHTCGLDSISETEICVQESEL